MDRPHGWPCPSVLNLESSDVSNTAHGAISRLVRLYSLVRQPRTYLGLVRIATHSLLPVEHAGSPVRHQGLPLFTFPSWLAEPQLQQVQTTSPVPREIPKLTAIAQQPIPSRFVMLALNSCPKRRGNASASKVSQNYLGLLKLPCRDTEVWWKT
ncbi:hypothetical protein VTI74DRAFT_10478 [Chaetomium olivicolor]